MILPNNESTTCEITIAPLVNDISGFQHLLSNAECLRLDKMKHLSRQCEFVSGRVLLRQRLAAQLHCLPNEVKLSIDSDGKPYCTSPNAPFFNISHCANNVAVAISPNPVGIDIEQYKAKRNTSRIAAHYYAESEIQTLEALTSEKDKIDYFYQLWVLKEAISKASGKGLGASINHIELQITNQEIKRINSNDQVIQLRTSKISKSLWLGLAVITENDLNIQITQLKCL